MARGRKKKQRVERVIKIKRSEIVDFYREQGRLKDQQASYTGQAGRDARTFKERTGLSPIALGFIGKLDRLGEDLKRQSVMDEVVFLFEAMGWNDQGNLFDRASTKIQNDMIKDDDGDDEDADDKDLRPAFLQNAMPLDEAKEKFDAALEVAEAKKAVAAKAAAKSKPADALSALAGEEPATAH
ncbi:hypothetical protein [Labrys neptuniae]|uniref:Terminase small subunit n=1 Tax=Labrys neptuniae TaxID=376174 RepID=A0ABV3PFW6_9HYPH